MTTPDIWSDFVATNPHVVDELHELRPSNPEVMQYLDGDHEYLAIHAEAPYGRAASNAAHLLVRTVVAQDYSIFLIPQYVASLPAATISSGEKEIKSLRPVYEAIGQLLYEAANGGPPSPPMIRIEDLAVDPRTGELFYIPPIHFSNNKASLDAYMVWMKQSIVRRFDNFFTRFSINILETAVQQGAHRE